MFGIALIVAVVISLLEVVKKLEIVNKKYIPLIALAIGIIAGLFYVDGTIKEQVFYGIMIGLTACGLFDQSKIVKKG